MNSRTGKNKKPNILMIVSDQQRYDCIGFSNRYPVKTPNIDKLATSGMWFNNAFTPIPLCCPARQALVNGRRPEAFGGLWNYDTALKVSALDVKEYSWARDLKQQQYNTAYVGKWHVNPTHNPTDFGYDHYIGTEHYVDFRNQKYSDVSYTNGWLGEIDPIPLEDARSHWMANKAIDIIKDYEKQDEPWHLRLDFEEPHLPCRPTGTFAEMYNPQTIPEWGGFNDEFKNKPYIQKQQLRNWDVDKFTWQDWAPAVARYYAIISQMDDAIGRVMNTLETLGVADNTIYNIHCGPW